MAKFIQSVECGFFIAVVSCSLITMIPLTFRPIWLAPLCAAVLQSYCSTATAAPPLLPIDVGTTVNGYQDDFGGSSLGAGWQLLGANVYSVSNGALHVTTALGDPNHLLYVVAGYYKTRPAVDAPFPLMRFSIRAPPPGAAPHSPALAFL